MKEGGKVFVDLREDRILIGKNQKIDFERRNCMRLTLKALIE
jgi:hypothetical protein